MGDCWRRTRWTKSAPTSAPVLPSPTGACSYEPMTNSTVLGNNGRAVRLWLLAVLCVLLSGASASAQDWNQWRGPARDGKVVGFAAPANWPKALTRKWQVDV